MRVKVSRKQIAENYYCISVGYCELQHLFMFQNSPYYNSGVYGWNFDVYAFEFRGCNVAITTGYRGMIDNCKGNKCTYETYREFDNKAALILTDNSRNKKEQLDALIQEFLTVVFSGVIK